jgi:hypothetical protein
MLWSLPVCYEYILSMLLELVGIVARPLSLIAAGIAEFSPPPFPILPPSDEHPRVHAQQHQWRSGHRTLQHPSFIPTSPSSLELPTMVGPPPPMTAATSTTGTALLPVTIGRPSLVESSSPTPDPLMSRPCRHMPLLVRSRRP